MKYLGYSLNTTDSGELEEAKELVSEARGRVAAFDTDQADELLTTGETAIAHGYSGDMFTQFLETDDPSRYVYFVPEEGGTRWIDNMAIPHDAPNPCTAHTFINWILDAENGAALSNYNYYSHPQRGGPRRLGAGVAGFRGRSRGDSGRGGFAGGDPGTPATSRSTTPTRSSRRSARGGREGFTDRNGAVQFVADQRVLAAP